MRQLLTLLLLVVTLMVMAACAAPAPQSEMSVAMPAEAPAAEPEMARDMAESGGAVESGGMVAPQQVAPDPRKIIYTGNIGIMVKDPAVAMQQIQDLATGAGGYTSQAQLYQYSGDL
ncbi:MAG TPA: DUF4349 domain-containing protein, partial [Anaerolineae bacterium]|nr:DUF4349 domain-containing protein [Anaerolineae bacterium]